MKAAVYRRFSTDRQTDRLNFLLSRLTRGLLVIVGAEAGNAI
jgi:hypothetical protein